MLHNLIPFVILYHLNMSSVGYIPSFRKYPGSISPVWSLCWMSNILVKSAVAATMTLVKALDCRSTSQARSPPSRIWFIKNFISFAQFVPGLTYHFSVGPWFKIQLILIFRVQLAVCVSQLVKHDYPGRWPGIAEKAAHYLKSEHHQTWMGALICIYQLVKNFE